MSDSIGSTVHWQSSSFVSVFARLQLKVVMVLRINAKCKKTSQAVFLQYWHAKIKQLVYF